MVDYYDDGFSTPTGRALFIFGVVIGFCAGFIAAVVFV